ncbi:MAG: hypothetical protein QOF76_814 [Solirubrobacteraceae bacterium]|jgi:deazaflavin-dependent oxidoreductase (nitroreductase family)|nr:hypothetical protein [Solirubrobacteraceae bacterium]
MAPRITRFLGTTTTLTLHHTGRRNGAARETELPFLEDGDNVVITAARGGSDLNPSWFHNLTATPEAAVTIGRKRRDVLARVAEGEEREALWPRLVEAIEELAEFQARTERRIPVIVLEPRA